MDDISDSSVVLGPHNGTDDRGVQDPRVVRDPACGIYWLTYRAFGSEAGIHLGIARSEDGVKWETVTYLPSDFVSAAILPRDNGRHYMFAGCVSVDVATSADFIHWDPINSSTSFGREHWLQGNPPSVSQRGIWVEPGPTPCVPLLQPGQPHDTAKNAPTSLKAFPPHC